MEWVIDFDWNPHVAPGVHQVSMRARPFSARMSNEFPTDTFLSVPVVDNALVDGDARVTFEVIGPDDGDPPYDPVSGHHTRPDADAVTIADDDTAKLALRLGLYRGKPPGISDHIAGTIALRSTLALVEDRDDDRDNLNAEKVYVCAAADELPPYHPLPVRLVHEAGTGVRLAQPLYPYDSTDFNLFLRPVVRTTCALLTTIADTDADPPAVVRIEADPAGLPAGVALVPGSPTVTIADDDPPIRVSMGHGGARTALVSEDGGTADFTVRLSEALEAHEAIDIPFAASPDSTFPADLGTHYSWALHPPTQPGVTFLNSGCASSTGCAGDPTLRFEGAQAREAVIRITGLPVDGTDSFAFRITPRRLQGQDGPGVPRVYHAGAAPRSEAVGGSLAILMGPDAVAENGPTSFVFQDEDDAAPSADIGWTKAGFSVNERNSPSSPVVELSRLLPHDVTVSVTVTDGTAVAGLDYWVEGHAEDAASPLSAEVLIPAGQRAGSFDIHLLNDDLWEGPHHETFDVAITAVSPAAGLTRVRDATTVTILDYDPGPAAAVDLGWTKGAFSVNERNSPASPVLRLSEALPHDLTVSVTVGAPGDTATPGTDYYVDRAGLGTPGPITVDLVVPASPSAALRALAGRFRPRGEALGANDAPLTATDDAGRTLTVDHRGVVDIVEPGDGRRTRFVPRGAPSVSFDGVTETFFQPDGTVTVGFDVHMVNDGIAEQSETFKVAITGVSPAAGVNRVRDETTVTILQAPNSLQVQGNGGIGVVNVQKRDDYTKVPLVVSLGSYDRIGSRTLWLEVRTRGGTALAHADYHPVDHVSSCRMVPTRRWSRGGTPPTTAGQAACVIEELSIYPYDERDGTTHFFVDVSVHPNNPEAVKRFIANTTATARINVFGRPGPGPSLSLEDATVREGRVATLKARLDAPAPEGFQARIVTRESTPASARSGVDYEHGHRVLTFDEGATESEYTLYVLDDFHDDDGETFEVHVVQSPVPVADGVAVVTIENDDPMPGAWLARFGRTVAEQAVEGVAGRLRAPRTPGIRGTVAGHALALAPPPDAFDAAAGPVPANTRSMTAREALLGSRFTLTGAEDASGGTLALWGRASRSRFDGAERDRDATLRLDGAVTTGMLGADYARGPWLAGLALTQTSAEGAWSTDDPARPFAPGDGEDGGRVEASLTAAVPYAALDASRRLKLWGAVGYGEGEVTLATAMGERLRADTRWTMAAAGVRGALIEAPAEGSGAGLALRSDALWARTASEKTRGLAASQSDVTRLRLGLEGSYRMAFEGGGSLAPALELGARHDGGDAETGFGVELGAGLAWRAPALGLALDLSGRTLLAHDDGDLEDRGFSAALGFDPAPASGRGPSLSLRQDFGGRAEGGLDALFAPAPLEDRTGSEAASRWTMEAAWGLPALGGRFTASPHVGLGLGSGARDLTLGWRLAPEGRTAPKVSLDVKAVRRERDTAPPEHTVGVGLRAAW